MPYLPVILHKPSKFLLSQSKSFVTFMVITGNVMTLPCASPSDITSNNARSNMFISSWKSEYFSSRNFPPTITGSLAICFGQNRSRVIFVNGVWNPTRVGTLTLKINSCSACFVCSNVKLSYLRNGASNVSKLENACAPAASPCMV